MGLVYTAIELFNYADETLMEEGYLTQADIRHMSVTAIADTGAIRLSINEKIRENLGLRIRLYQQVTLADGSKRTLAVAGPVRIKFRDRDCLTDAFVLPDAEEPLLGAVPMELMDLAVIPAENKVDYNPKHPDGANYSLKSAA
jgi:clan AA aspartic protease